jgi:hypothetical protein
MSVDLGAPGTNILSTYLDGNYAYMMGTSMATPHVSGVAALVKAVNPRLTKIQIKDIILTNVDVIPSLSEKVNTSGRLNAYKAVLAAQMMAGAQKIGTYNPDLSIWYLDYNGNGIWEPGTDKVSSWGAPGYQPVIGNWDGSVDGKVKIGTYNPDLSIWYLDYNGNGIWELGTDKVYSWGAPGYAPVTGDWNGDGKGKKIGTYNPDLSLWYLDYNGNGIWEPGTDKVYRWGAPGYAPVVGKWS